MTHNQPQSSSFQKALDIIQPFWIGGLSGMIATSVVQPIDMIKTVIQIKSEAFSQVTHSTQRANFLTAFKDIFGREGVKGFYRG